jgi:hypothetical protein
LQFLIEREAASLVLHIVGDVGSLDRGRVFARFSDELGGMDLELEGVQGNGLGSFLDLEVDVDFALVGPWLAGEEVEEADGVICGLDT